VRVREARASDAPELARLSTELGYPVTEEALRERLPRLLAEAEKGRGALLVAEHDGVACGWCHVVAREGVTDALRAEILGLVVDERLRGAGIGRRLVERALSWSRRRGCPRVVVRSRTSRTDAHAFYERLGWTRSKTQHVFEREA